jgi:hypothetical protein
MNTPTPELIEGCVQIVETAAELCDGKLPADRGAFVALILSRFANPENVPDEIRARLSLAEWEQARADFALALVMAVDCVERDRKAMYRN